MILIAIRERLISSTDLEAIVQEKIYPIAISQKVKAPAVTYNAITTPDDSKSGGIGDKEQCSVVAVSRTISELSELGSIVRELFHNKVWSNPEYSYLRGKVLNITRDYSPEYEEYRIDINIELTSKFKK